MKNADSDQTLGRFLVSILPDRTRTSYEILAALSFPLNDHASAAEQIEKRCSTEKWDAARTEASRRILEQLTPADFPIASQQGALEKYFTRLPLPDLSRFFPHWQIPPPQLERPDVPVRREYLALFGPRCEQAAWEGYQAALRSGFPEPRAYYEGIVAGRRCVASG